MNGGIVLPYLDVPFQHASPKVLKDMRRPGNQEKTLERIRAWRAICPDLTIRSTFIVGFPGETRGGFSPAARLARRGQARPRRRLQIRAGRRRARQRSRARTRARRDQTKPLEALHGAPAGDQRQETRGQGRQAARGASSTKAASASAKGRSKGDAPEIDGAVHVATRRPLARRRHRQREDRARRRLRSVGDGGIEHSAMSSTHSVPFPRAPTTFTHLCRPTAASARRRQAASRLLRCASPASR